MPYTAKTIGASNKIVGEWLKKRSVQKRSEIVINANICGYDEGIDWTLRRKQDPTIDWKCTDLSRKQIIAAVDTQLQQLGVDCIDILSFQWPERYCATLGQREYLHTEERTEKETTSIFNQLETLQELIKCGKIRAYGLSNETPYGLACFSTTAKLCNLPQPTITTHPLNLLCRYETEKGTQCYCNCLCVESRLIDLSRYSGGVFSERYCLCCLLSTGRRSPVCEISQASLVHGKQSTDQVSGSSVPLHHSCSYGGGQEAAPYGRGVLCTTSTICTGLGLPQTVCIIHADRLVICNC